MSIIKRMDHFTVTSSDLAATTAFYGLLGLAPGQRPPFKFPGLWLYSGEMAILHVVSTETLPEQADGVIDHIAFWAHGLSETLAVLAAQAIEYKLMRAPPPYDLWQLFFRDPFGAMVELNFDRTEAAPEAWQETSRPHQMLNVPSKQ